MFCSGYPSSTNPQRGVFTHRTAKAISKNAEVEVIVLSSFNFRRKLKESYVYEGINVLRLAIPQVPHLERGFLIGLNAFLLDLGVELLLMRRKIESFDLIHSSMLIPTSTGISKWVKSVGIPHIGQAIGDDVNLYLDKVKEIGIIKNRLCGLDAIQFNSKALKENFEEIFPEGKKESNFVLYRGVDGQRFKPNPSIIRACRVRLLYLGGMQTYDPEQYGALNTKGGHILMEAWQSLDQEKINIEMTFAGPGNDPELLSHWHLGLNFPNRVTILGAIKPYAIPELILNHDLVVIPSLYEGLPNLANEAQAMGVPVIGSNAGGIPETVEHGHTGFIFERGDSNSLVNTIKAAVEDKSHLKKLGLNGRKKMLQERSWEAFTETLLEKYRSLR